jgi:hypothetical protein
LQIRFTTPAVGDEKPAQGFAVERSALGSGFQITLSWERFYGLPLAADSRLDFQDIF